MTVEENHSAMLDCVAGGAPEPEITWTAPITSLGKDIHSINTTPITSLGKDVITCHGYHMTYL